MIEGYQFEGRGDRDEELCGVLQSAHPQTKIFQAVICPGIRVPTGRRREEHRKVVRPMVAEGRPRHVRGFPRWI